MARRVTLFLSRLSLHGSLQQSPLFGRSMETRILDYTKRSFSDGRVTGLNILKQGQDPEEMKDEDVPEWLSHLGSHGNGSSLLEMERQVKERGVEGLSLNEMKYLRKLQNRKRIKHLNSLKAK